MKPATRRQLRRWGRGVGRGARDRVTATDKSVTKGGMPASFKVRGVDWRLVTDEAAGLDRYEAAGLPPVYCYRDWPGRFLGVPHHHGADHWEVSVATDDRPVLIGEVRDVAVAFRLVKELAGELIDVAGA